MSNSKWNLKKYNHLFPICHCNGKPMTPSHLKTKKHLKFEKVSTLITKSYAAFLKSIPSRSEQDTAT